MFERYTEAARKVIFYGRYEASQWGSLEIETEHLLLGLLHENGDLVVRTLHKPVSAETLRTRIEQRRPAQKTSVSRSGDLPLSHESKRVLAYASEEAERLAHKHIGAEHLLMGIGRETGCVAAKLLEEHGFKLPLVRDEAIVSAASRAAVKPPAAASGPALYRDLTALARSGSLGPLVGRERELDRIIHILSRRTKNNVALVGPAGVGKKAILTGLAQRAADGELAIPDDRSLIAIDAAALIVGRQQMRASERTEQVLDIVAGQQRAVLAIEGFFGLAAVGWGALEAMHLLEPRLASGMLQCIATGSPEGFRYTLENAAWITRHFEVVQVAEPDEEYAIRIATALKEQYEQFHGVEFAEGAIEAAVRASGRFLRDRHLPDRALDLLDEAGTRAKLRAESEPSELAEVRRRVRRNIKQMENAIVRHEFDKARSYSDEDRRDREILARLEEQHKADKAARKTVFPSDIEEAVAARIGVPVTLVRTILQEEPGPPAPELEAALPAAERQWLPFSQGYLSRCSQEEAERLAQAIQKAKGAAEG